MGFRTSSAASSASCSEKEAKNAKGTVGLSHLQVSSEQRCDCDHLKELDANHTASLAQNPTDPFGNVKPDLCEAFCCGTTCTCLISWAERCKLRSCAGCSSSTSGT